jgi:hypothetical protein
MIAERETILSDLRRGLVSGDYSVLSGLLPQLEQIEAEAEFLSAADLHSLKAEAERAQACLQAAVSGVRAARRRMTDVADAARGLTTYGPDGVKATLPTTPPGSRRI